MSVLSFYAGMIRLARRSIPEIFNFFYRLFINESHEVVVPVTLTTEKLL